MLFQRVTFDKKTTFCNSYVSSLTIFLKQHSANRSLRQLRKNLDSCKLKLFRSTGQDNHRISDRADFIIRLLGGVGCRRVASSGRSCRLILSLALLSAAASYRASGLVHWHKADVEALPANVRC